MIHPRHAAVAAVLTACSPTAAPSPAAVAPTPSATVAAPVDPPPRPPAAVVELAPIAKNEKVTSICADATTVYYTVFGGGPSKLMRVARTGGKAELLAKGDKIFGHCALDADAIYFAALSRLMRLPKASAPESGAEKELFDGGMMFSVNDIAVDDAHVYFTTQGALQRIAKTGGKPELLLFHPLGESITIASPVLDATHVFALRIQIQKQAYELVRVAKNKSPAKPEVIAAYQRLDGSPTYGSGMSPPVLSNGYVYWAQGDRKILRAPSKAGPPEPLMTADALVLALGIDGDRIAYASAGKTEASRALVHVAAEPSGKTWKESGRSAFAWYFVIDHAQLFGAFPAGEEEGGTVGRID